MTIEEEIIKIRRYIHENPELSGKEYGTAKFIEIELKNLQIPYKRIGETGVIATLASAKPGKTLALRADIDALPICESNNVGYRSKKKGVMHACGHDAHIAIMLGAAKLLRQRKKEIAGNIRFIFQPSEETSNGAKTMIAGGALKNPDVDFILGTHVNPWIKTGKVGLKFGAMMAAVDRVKIKIVGEIAHGAYPHNGKDALVAASAFINMVQCVISRELDPLENAVITFGKIEGGDAYNIICSKVTIDGTVRSFNKETRSFIKKSILRKLKAVETAYNVKCFVEYDAIGEPLINAFELVKICIKTAEKFYGKNSVEILEKPSMGGEDFSDYLSVVPGNFIYIGTAKDEQTSRPWHHDGFDIDESALPKAAKYIGRLTFSLLKA